MRRLSIVVSLLALLTGSLIAQVSFTGTGYWSNPANWDSGYVPTAASDVIIPSGKTDSIDISNAECKNLTISGNLYFARTNGNGITIHGNTVINAGGRFRMSSATPTAGSFFQYIDFKGDLTVNSTGVFDMRQASGSIGSVGRVRFSGATNSNVALALTTYTSATEEFNSLEIAKTSGGKVVLTSGYIFLSNNSSSLPDTLIFTSGVVETGSNRIIHLATGAASVQGGSTTSYVNGTIGRGISNSVGTGTRTYPIGDGTKYRPVSVTYNAPANATGHYVWAKLITGNANTGSSSLTGGIDKVSPSRYYEVGYSKNAGSSTTMNFTGLNPSYQSDDGVSEGNTNLRVAYSTDARATWANAGPTGHTTTPASLTTLSSSTISPDMVLNDGASVFIALANETSGSNPLPVELNSFAAEVIGAKVQLRWSTATEQNNAGFDVEKLIGKDWTKIGTVEGHGTTNAPQSYSFFDARAKGRVVYRLKQIDRDGAFTYSRTVEANAGLTASDFTLTQNHPNPFNPSTSFSFAVPASEQVSVTVYNALGQAVRELFNGIAQANELYTLSFDGSGLSSGTYFYTLRSASRNEVRKMSLMK
ncbi:MAG: T9SS type A sorting domain-containing protein [Bacteroidetes bacterium]|nr:T9SS type A sorting domain-containing protein [Bacteroidota bacterium]